MYAVSLNFLLLWAAFFFFKTFHVSFEMDKIGFKVSKIMFLCM